MLRVLALSALSLFAVGCGGDDDSDSDTDLPEDTGTTEPQWVTVQDGLQIRDVVEGDGAEVMSGDTITAHYTLWLYENDAKGSQLETSRSGNPFSAPVGQGRLIQGWEIGIPGMKVGGQRELIIAPELAYGANGQGAVPPNATLFFEVEVLSVP